MQNPGSSASLQYDVSEMVVAAIATEARLRREAFVTGHNGAGAMETICVVSFIPVGVFVMCESAFGHVRDCLFPALV